MILTEPIQDIGVFSEMFDVASLIECERRCLARQTTSDHMLRFPSCSTKQAIKPGLNGGASTPQESRAHNSRVRLQSNHQN
jgi:hypothetical protein